MEAFSVQDDEIVVIYEGGKGTSDQVMTLDPRTGEDTSSHGFFATPLEHFAPAWTFRHRGLTLMATSFEGPPLVAYRKDKG